MFEHERLEVYRYARELNRELCRLSKIARKGNYDHIDQVIRCGSSITRNLAEGCGEWQPKEKAKFYRYAKRSAGECAAGLDVLVDYDMLRDEDVTHAKELLSRIIPMLIKLIQIFEGGVRPKGEMSAVASHPIPRTRTSPSPNFRARARDP